MKRCLYCRNTWPAARERCPSCGAALPAEERRPEPVGYLGHGGGSSIGSGGAPEYGYLAMAAAQQNQAAYANMSRAAELENMKQFMGWCGGQK